MNYLSLILDTYGDRGITEMDSATGSIYLGNPRVDRHHRIIRNKHFIIPSSWSHALLPSFHRSTHYVWFLTHSCQAFIDPPNLCGSSWPGIPWCPLTLFLCFSSKNHSFSGMPFGSHVGCGGVLMIGSPLSSSCISPHRDWVNVEMQSGAVIEWVCWPRSWVIAGSNRVSLETHLESVIERGWKCSWEPWSWILGARNCASLEIYLEDVLEWDRRCTWRWGLVELAGRNHVSFEIHLKTVIKRVWRCIWRPWSSDFGDALESCDRASLEMHLKAMIVWVWTYTWRLCSIECGDALGGCECPSLEMPLEAMIKRDWRCTWGSTGKRSISRG